MICPKCQQPVTGLYTAYRGFNAATCSPSKAEVTTKPCQCVHDLTPEQSRAWAAEIYPKAS